SSTGSRSTSSPGSGSTPASRSCARSATRSRSSGCSRGRSAGGVVPLAALADPLLLLQLAHHPVEVVGLDPHLLGDLRGGDPRVLADDLHGLVGAGSAAAAALARARSTRPAGAAATDPAPRQVRERPL